MVRRGALGLDVLGTFTVGAETFMIGALDVEPGSRLAGLSLDRLAVGTRVIAIDPAGSRPMEHPPRRGTRLEAGDRAYLVGPYEELLVALEEARTRVPSGG